MDQEQAQDCDLTPEQQATLTKLKIEKGAFREEFLECLGSMNRRFCPQHVVETQAIRQAQWEDAEKTIFLQFHPNSLYTPSIIYCLAKTHSNKVTQGQG